MSGQCLAVRQGQLASPAVAMLRWDSGKPKVSIIDKSAERNLRPYLHKTLSKPPFRIRRRQRAGSGRVELIAEEVAPSDSDFLGRWAAKLTFNSLNSHDFIFTVPSSRGTIPTSPPEDSELASNLFELSGTFDSSVVTCPCGARYPFLTLKCPTCGGTDPIGALWQKHGTAILEAFCNSTHEQLATKSPLHQSLQAARQSFAGATSAASSSTRLPTETDDKETIARKLLCYYEGVFRQGCLNEGIIAALKTAPGSETVGLIAGLRNAALGIRRRWNPDSTIAWNPSEAFKTECRAGILDAAQPALRGTGHTAKRMVKVAAQYGPFHREFTKRITKSEPTPFDFLKVAWTVFKAVKTLGGSLLFRGVMKLLRDKKFQERFERFSVAFDGAVGSCATIQGVIDQALRSHNELLTRAAKGMRYHLVAVFAEDFAASGPDEQERLADSLARIAGRPPLKRRPLYARGLEAQKRRKDVLARCLVGGVFLFFGLVALLVMLSRS